MHGAKSLLALLAAWAALNVEAMLGKIPFGMFWKGRIYGRISCESAPLVCPGGAKVYQVERLDCEYPPCPPTTVPTTSLKPVVTSAPVRVVPGFVYLAPQELPLRRPSRKYRATL